MPLQYIPDNTIGDAFAQLGNTIGQGPQLQLHAMQVGEAVRTSAQKREELRNQMDAQQLVGNLTNTVDQLKEQKRQAGAAWTPEQETQLIGANTAFGQAVTRASALLGKSAEDITKGVYASRGQQDLAIAPQPVGSPRYLQQMGAIEGKLPAPAAKESKLENVGIQGPDGSITYRSTTDGGKTDALTNQPMAAFVPPGHRLLASGALTVPTAGQSFDDNAINESLLRATQQIQAGVKPTEDPASLAAKYNKLFKTEQMTEPGAQPGSRVIVGLQKTVPNATYAPLHAFIDNYYRTTRPQVADAPAGGQAGAAAASPAASLMQAPQQQPAATNQGGLVNGVWRPSGPKPMTLESPGGGATVSPLMRGFDQQAVSRFQQDPVVAKYRVADQMYNEMQRAAKYDSGYADLHLIYALAKVFDPGSAVRGEELVLGRNAQQWQQWLGGWFNYVRGGGRLTAASKAQMLDQAYTSATSNFEAAANLADQTQKQLLANNLDPSQHLPELNQPQKNDPREINRYGGGYASNISDPELIRIAGRLQPGSAPVATDSTSAAGPPPAAPAIQQSNRSGINAAAAPVAPAGGATPALQAGGPLQQLLNDADAITGRKRR